MAGEMLERPLDRSRPLWEMALVEGLEGGRVALLAKLHHATMDGLAGISLMASLFGTTPEIAPPPDLPRETPDRVPSGLELLREFRGHDAGTPVLLLTARSDESVVPLISRPSISIAPEVGS